MRHSRPWWILLALSLSALAASLPSMAHGFYLPSFQLDRCAWMASHIVVVTEGDTIDGDVRIIESWKGDLTIGEEITVPGLERCAVPETRRIFEAFAQPTKELVTGQRIVLFLKRTPQGRWDAAHPEMALGGIGISSAWIEGGRAHVRSQLRSSGGQLFHASGTEIDLRERVFEVLAAQKELAQAKVIVGAKTRMAALKSLVRSSVRETISGAVAEIEAAGTGVAAPVLRALLVEEDLRSVATLHVARALVRLEGDAAGADLVSLLERELEFWEKADAGKATGTMDDRADKAQYLIEVLGGFDYPPCVPAIEAFRDLLHASKKLAPYRSSIDYSVKRVLEKYRAREPDASDSNS